MAYIINCGAATPVGRTSPVSVASARAGISRLTRHHSFRDKAREHVIVGMANYINEYCEISDRLTQLLTFALEETFADLSSIAGNSEIIDVIIGIPEDRPGLPEDMQVLMEKSVLEVGKSHGYSLNLEFINEGHTAGLMAVKQADNLVEEGQKHLVIAGGVDSYLHYKTLSWLLDNNRLFCTHNNDGFIPGEAAAFCVIASEEIVSRIKRPSVVKICQIGIEEEANPHGSEITTLGTGLSAAVEQALGGLTKERKVDQIFYGLNGESFNALELGYTLSRKGQHFNDIQNFVNWSKCWGDLGAASAIVSVCCVLEAARKKYTKGPLNMVLASNLGNKRGAALLETMA